MTIRQVCQAPKDRIRINTCLQGWITKNSIKGHLAVVHPSIVDRVNQTLIAARLQPPGIRIHSSLTLSLHLREHMRNNGGRHSQVSIILFGFNNRCNNLQRFVHPSESFITSIPMSSALMKMDLQSIHRPTTCPTRRAYCGGHEFPFLARLTMCTPEVILPLSDRKKGLCTQAAFIIGGGYHRCRIIQSKSNSSLQQLMMQSLVCRHSIANDLVLQQCSLVESANKRGPSSR